MALADRLITSIEGCGEYIIPDMAMKAVAKEVLTSIDTAHKNESCFRASSIGKPWITQILNNWYPSTNTVKVYNASTQMKMFDGVVTQAWLEFVLRGVGYNIECEREWEYTVAPLRVVGHSDIVVQQGNQAVLLEVKSMGSHLVRDFRTNPTDAYGYVSQLAFYHHCLRLAEPDLEVESAFVIYDRSNAKFYVRYMSEYLLGQKWTKLNSVLSILKLIKPGDLETLLSIPDLIPPLTERGQIPPSMSFSKWAKCLYRKTEVGYEFRDPTEMKHMILALSEEPEV